MTSKLVRHHRIVNLRDMALKGANIQQLRFMCKKMGLSPSSTTSYMKEVIEDIRKVTKDDKQV